MKSGSSSPPLKKAKLEPLSPSTNELQTGSSVKVKIESDGNASVEAHNSDDENNCSICLQNIVDRTVIPTCSHEFCFDCVLVWTEQSRRCPLCSQAIGQYLIHSIRSRYDYRKHFLAPLRTSPPVVRSQIVASSLQDTRRFARRRRRERESGIREREERDEMDKLDMSIAKRKWIYEHDLYAKHVASNSYTKYRPYPTPAQFSASPELISRTITFLRRELQVWEGLDVEFLTTMIISLMKSIDIRSETAVKLLSEFLDLDAPYIPGGRHVKAEHFAHEVYCYVRSPYRDLFVYDTIVQYDSPPDVPLPTEPRRTRRWREREASPLLRTSEYLESPLEERPRSRSRSLSWSPSGRRYPNPREIEKASGSKSNRSLNLVAPDCDVQDQKWPTGDEKTREQLEPVERDEGSVDYGASRVSTPDPASVRAIDRKGKGKQKDHNPHISENHSALEPKSPLKEEECYHPALIVTDNPHSHLRHVRAPKNLNLRESVQAHLSGRETMARTSGARRISSNPGTAKSLLARLSTPSLDVSNQAPTAIQTQESASVSHSEANDKDLVLPISLKVSSSTPRVTHENDTEKDPVTASNSSLEAGQWRFKGSERRPPSRLSKSFSPPTDVISGSHDYGSAGNLLFPASELGRDASTLHRSSYISAEVTKNSVFPRHPSSSHRNDINIKLHDESHVDSPPRDQKPPNPIQSNIQLNSAPDLTLQMVPRNSLDARTRLLSRLKSERDHARSRESADSSATTTRKEPDVTSSLDITFPRNGRRRRSPITDSLGLDQVADNVAVEAKLRLRAQVRARLAAEKRRDVNHPGTGPEISNEMARE